MKMYISYHITKAFFTNIKYIGQEYVMGQNILKKFPIKCIKLFFFLRKSFVGTSDIHQNCIKIGIEGIKAKMLSPFTFLVFVYNKRVKLSYNKSTITEFLHCLLIFFLL